MSSSKLLSMDSMCNFLAVKRPKDTVGLLNNPKRNDKHNEMAY